MTASVFQQKQKPQMPFATDEEWEARIAKREKEVETIKSLQSYRLYAEVFPRSERGEDDPQTPDPRDRTVSKRMWKWNVEKWRLQLKSRCVYSRGALLQCREVALLASVSEASSDSLGTEKLQATPTRFLKMMSLPEPPGIGAGSAALSRRAGSKIRASSHGVDGRGKHEGAHRPRSLRVCQTFQ